MYKPFTFEGWLIGFRTGINIVIRRSLYRSKYPFLYVIKGIFRLLVYGLIMVSLKIKHT